MKIILLENVNGTGKKYDVKDVADGYARNFLIPNKLAEIATGKSLAKLERDKKLWEEKNQKLLAELETEARKLESLTLTFNVKVGKKKEVFGSITSREIEAALKEKGFKNAKSELPNPLKELGEHSITIDLGEGVKTKIKTVLREEQSVSKTPSHYLDDLNKFL